MASKDRDKDREREKRQDTEPVVHDRRRIDPETGEVRHDPESESASSGASAKDAPAQPDETLTDEDLARLLEEPAAQASPASPKKHAAGESDHLADLKRIQAEYANYRKRVERDRSVARELAIAEVIASMLPVLDDLDLAHAHGDLEGSPLELVAQKLRTGFERYGLTQIGEKGELFDPNLHEAIAQEPTKDVTENTVADVIKPGYLIGERLLRPARVVVSVPEE